MTNLGHLLVKGFELIRPDRRLLSPLQRVHTVHDPK